MSTKGACAESGIVGESLWSRGWCDEKRSIHFGTSESDVRYIGCLDKIGLPISAAQILIDQ